MQIDEHAWQLLINRLDSIDQRIEIVFSEFKAIGNDYDKCAAEIHKIKETQRFNNGRDCAKSNSEDISRMISQIRAQWVAVGLVAMSLVVQVVLSIIGVV
jgi:hypothetical protein